MLLISIVYKAVACVFITKRLFVFGLITSGTLQLDCYLYAFSAEPDLLSTLAMLLKGII